MMRKLLEAGMNVARLNFSHGDFAGHARVIANLRAAAKAAGRRIAIMRSAGPEDAHRHDQSRAGRAQTRRGFTLTTGI